MAYTGTGTQSDPYVVTTFADFLTCVAQEGVYVEVGADLDAAEEGYGYISPIDVKAVEVYGTSGDTLRKISNVTVEGNALFDLHRGSGDQSLIRLHLENLTWKAATTPYVTNHFPIMFYRSNANGYLNECKVSVSVTPAANNTNIRMVNRTSITDSAIVMELNSGIWYPNTNNSENEAWINSTISLNGTGTASWNAGTSASERIRKSTNCGFVLKNMVCSGSCAFYTASFSYIVYEDCDLTGATTLYGDSSNLFCFAGTTSDESARVISGTVVTQSQLKDKAYLQSIGWLP